MEKLENFMLVKFEDRFGIVEIFRNKVLIVELEEKYNQIVKEMINMDCLILEYSQREEILRGRPIPKTIEKTSTYRLYEWTDTKEQFIVRLDDFCKKPIMYDIYLIIKTDLDIKTQVFKLRKYFPMFKLDLKDMLKNARESKEVLFAKYLSKDSALGVFLKGRELDLKMRMEKSSKS